MERGHHIFVNHFIDVFTSCHIRQIFLNNNHQIHSINNPVLKSNTCMMLQSLVLMYGHNAHKVCRDQFTCKFIDSYSIWLCWCLLMFQQYWNSFIYGDLLQHHITTLLCPVSPINTYCHTSRLLAHKKGLLCKGLYVISLGCILLPISEMNDLYYALLEVLQMSGR